MVAIIVSHLSPLLFHFIYVLLMSVFLFSLFSIAESVWSITDVEKVVVLYIALITVNSAAFYFLRKLLFYGVAYQYILGTSLQPSTFGVLLLASVAFFLKKRSVLSVLLAAMASVIHPTYLICSAVLIFCYLKQFQKDGLPLKKIVGLVFVSLAVVSYCILYSLHHFIHASPTGEDVALRILVNMRIPHHAIPARWFDWSTAVKLLVVLVTLFVSRKTRIFSVLFYLTAIGGALSLAVVITDNVRLALLFPWRVSVLLLPMCAALLIGYGIQRLPTTKLKRRGRLSAAYLTVLSVVGIGVSLYMFHLFETAPNIPVNEYVKRTKKSGEIYLVRPQMKQFRLRAEASIFVDYKTHPFKSTEIVEWNRRVAIADKIYNSVGGERCEAVENVRQEYAVTHIVYDSTTILDCEGWLMTYRDKRNSIYRYGE